jgi:hypothetical protein
MKYMSGAASLDQPDAQVKKLLRTLAPYAGALLLSKGDGLAHRSQTM